MKRPAFQFYPGDWRKDVELRSCSLAARGLWIDLMAVMHDCEPYGHLALNGRPMTLPQIAGQISGASAQEIKRLLSELIENGVARTTDSGLIYSKRMVEDEDLRERRANGGQAGAEHGNKGGAHGAKGGRPKSPTGGSETPLETPLEGAAKPPPSSSSSSTTSIPTNPNGEGLGTPPPSAPGSGGGDVDGHEPTPQGRICRALKAAGMASVNPGDPRLLALIGQGATDAEFIGAGQEAVDKGKGFAWMLAALAGKRQDAATLKLAPAAKAAPSPTEWRKSERGMRAMHAQLGLKSTPGESMDEWDARLLRAWQRAGEPPLQGAASA